MKGAILSILTIIYLSGCARFLNDPKYPIIGYYGTDEILVEERLLVKSIKVDRGHVIVNGNKYVLSGYLIPDETNIGEKDFFVNLELKDSLILKPPQVTIIKTTGTVFNFREITEKDYSWKDKIW